MSGLMLLACGRQDLSLGPPEATVRTLSLHLHRTLDDVRLGRCQRALGILLATRLDPAACHEALARYCDEHGLHDLLDVEAVRHGGLLARQPLLEPAPGRWVLVARSADRRSGAAVEVEPEGLPTLGRLLRSTRRLAPEDVEQAWRFLGPEVARALADDVRRRAPVPLAASRPGVQRLPHAALLVRSRTTALLLDPIALGDLPSMRQTPADGLDIDGILVTHTHSDHWHLPSTLHFAASPDTPVVCPPVPRLNLLTRSDPASDLEACGQRSLAPSWGETVRLGDIEIDVLPFFGEQPTRDPPGAPEPLRNWGSCYRFQTEDFSAVVLVDAGTDPLGSVEEVLADSAARRGAPDIVFACLRRFSSPFFGGLPDDWLALPFERLRALHRLHEAGRLPPTTAGPAGLAVACTAAGAAAFAPYANGHEGWGAPITDIGWGEGEASEASALHELAQALGNGPTRIIPWLCGEQLTMDDA